MFTGLDKKIKYGTSWRKMSLWRILKSVGNMFFQAIGFVLNRVDPGCKFL